MAASFAAIALIPGIEKQVLPFLLIYGLSYFFTEFGPNATTFVYRAELFPPGTRTSGHGIAAATGKIGAFIGVFLFPLLMNWKGFSGRRNGSSHGQRPGYCGHNLLASRKKEKRWKS